jgi:hypothetical protein
VKFPTAKKKRLTQLVAAANDANFPLRVGLIANSYELGAVLQLWKQPRVYAEFAGEELKVEAKYRGRILIVMPDGFGFHWEGHPATKQYASLDSIRIAPGSAGLIDGAIAGVRRLAADSSVPLRVQADTTAERNDRDRVKIVVAVAVALAVGVLARELLRRRRRQVT